MYGWLESTLDEELIPIAGKKLGALDRDSSNGIGSCQAAASECSEICEVDHG
jgi:hypothetical protein